MAVRNPIANRRRDQFAATVADRASGLCRAPLPAAISAAVAIAITATGFGLAGMGGFALPRRMLLLGFRP